MLREFNLRTVNSATKYPSIPTYHTLGNKGMLRDEHIDFEGTEVVATEKVDGTNSRIIIFPDGSYLIGSREELLTAQGDLIPNPMLGIAETLRPTADRFYWDLDFPDMRHQLLRHPLISDKIIGNSLLDSIIVFYFEVYGGKTTKAAKQYTSDRSLGFRLFDVAEIPLSMLDKRLEEFSIWRENGGQHFFDEATLLKITEELKLELTPRILLNYQPPVGIKDTYEWLKHSMPESLVTLDDGAKGRPEGLVIRTPDRSVIAKARFEDYDRHMIKVNLPSH